LRRGGGQGRGAGGVGGGEGGAAVVNAGLQPLGDLDVPVGHLKRVVDQRGDVQTHSA
jgi:hypothetical protein